MNWTILKQICCFAFVALVMGSFFLTLSILRADSSQVAPAKQFKNSIGMQFVEIKPGTFTMGSPADEAGRNPDEVQHQVTLTKGFMMGIHHVTVGQFKAFVNATGYKTEAEADTYANWRTPSFEQTDDHPAVCISWNDAVAFAQWISKQEGKKYRLPTEAEWEYACRAGTQTAYCWGNNPDDGKGWCNAADLTFKDKFPKVTDVFNWRDGFVYTSPVGSFKANAWGLYDMHGNAMEWCSDWYGEYPKEAVTDPTGAATGEARVLRGGSWYNDPRVCRSGDRRSITPTYQNDYFGFRLVLDLN